MAYYVSFDSIPRLLVAMNAIIYTRLGLHYEYANLNFILMRF